MWLAPRAESASARTRDGGGEAKLESFEGGHGFTMPDPQAKFSRVLNWLSRL